MDVPEINSILKYSGIALLLFLSVGIVGGFVADSQISTNKACLCSSQLDKIFGESQTRNNSNNTVRRIPCNSVDKVEYVFYTGIFNIGREMSGQEIVMCENGERTGQKIEYENKENYKLRFLGF